MNKIVNILPHVQQLYLQNNKFKVVIQSINPQLYNWSEELKFIPKDELSFSRITKWKKFLKISDSIDEPQSLMIKGDTIYLNLPGYLYPIRAEFFDDEIEHLRLWDTNHNRAVEELNEIIVSGYGNLDLSDVNSIKIEHSEESKNIVFFANYNPKYATGLTYKIEDYEYLPLFWQNEKVLISNLESWDTQGYRIYLSSNKLSDISSESLNYIDKENPYSSVNLTAGFLSKDRKEVLLTDRELFGSIYIRKTAGLTQNSQKLLDQLAGEITINDYIVHQEHGIGIYKGFTTETINGQLNEYIQIDYADNDQLFVPIHQQNKISRYIGEEGIPPKITKLNKTNWIKTVNKARVQVKILANELANLYARRKLSTAKVVKEEDSKAYLEFVEAFKFKETIDQITAINEILDDLSNKNPMNRVLIGDVGYGKTEVMMRATYKICETGNQVAIIAPTTILASQHYLVFKERFKSSNFKIAILSRMNTTKQNKETVDKINKGEFDIVIGTHRLLSQDLKFNSLGLVIVDEEQRFGVKQKEKIKKLNANTHSLFVSATPIPRTLSMALSGIQEISLINTPPPGRKPIETHLEKTNWSKIRDIIQFEVKRGGQVYFVHNEVRSIESITKKVLDLLPGVKIDYAHGQMPPSILDKKITDFSDNKFQILLATTIIENGIDISNVNTIIINKAERFGLAQLYQLRGRVGRSEKKAYCYLFYSQFDKEYEERGISKNYMQRLQALVEASNLGSGYKIASKDLEIRGAGNLLGEKQSGHISEMGYAFYMQMLANEIDKLKVGGEWDKKPEYVSL